MNKTANTSRTERTTPGHYWIPSQVRLHDDLNPTDAFVFAAIYWFAEMKESACTASNSTVAEAAGCATTTVGKSLKRLENCGFIKRKFNKNSQRIEIKVLLVPQTQSSKSGEGVSQSEEGVSYSEEGGQSERGQNNSCKNNSNTSLKKTSKKHPSTESKQKPDRKAAESGDTSWDDDDPMNLNEFVQWCRTSDQRHIGIIGEYADEKGLEYKTYEQWQQLIKRNVRPANRLSPFTDDQIADAMENLNSDKAENDGYITRWTLETVEKYLEHN